MITTGGLHHGGDIYEKMWVFFKAKTKIEVKSKSSADNIPIQRFSISKQITVGTS